MVLVPRDGLGEAGSGLVKQRHVVAMSSNLAGPKRDLSSPVEPAKEVPVPTLVPEMGKREAATPFNNAVQLAPPGQPQDTHPRM